MQKLIDDPLIFWDTTILNIFFYIERNSDNNLLHSICNHSSELLIPFFILFLVSTISTKSILPIQLTTSSILWTVSRIYAIC